MPSLRLAGLVLVLCCARDVHAQQPFEGTITYAVTIEGEGIGQLSALLPTGYTVEIQGMAMRIHLEGGLGGMMGDILIQGAQQQVYVLHEAEQVAYTLPSQDDSENLIEDVTTVVTREEGEKRVAGYACEPYRVETTSPEETSTQHICIAPEIHVSLPDGEHLAMGALILEQVEGVTGFPLQVRMILPDEMGTIGVEATRIEAAPLGKERFAIPDHFTIKPYNPASLMGGF